MTEERSTSRRPFWGGIFLALFIVGWIFFGIHAVIVGAIVLLARFIAKIAHFRWRGALLLVAVPLCLLYWDVPLRRLQFAYLCHWRDFDGEITDRSPLDRYVLPEGPGCDEQCRLALLEYGIGEVVRFSTVKLEDGSEEGWVRYHLSAIDGAVCPTGSDVDCIVHEKLEQFSGREAYERIRQDWLDLAGPLEKKSDLLFPYFEDVTDVIERSSGKTIKRSVSYSMVTRDVIGRFIQREFLSGHVSPAKCYSVKKFHKYPLLGFGR